MKAVRTLPSWKRVDSLFLCVLLTSSVLCSTTPCSSPSPEKLPLHRSQNHEGLRLFFYLGAWS